MKQNYFYVLIIASLCLNLNAQEHPGIYLTWDSEVMCSQYDSDEGLEEMLETSESIRDLPCLKVCHGSQVNYTLVISDEYMPMVVDIEWQSNIPYTVTRPDKTNILIDYGLINNDSMMSITAVVTLDDGQVLEFPLCITYEFPIDTEFKVGGLEPPYTFCVGQEIPFQNLTTVNGGGNNSNLAMNYHWDFGDGTTSNAYEPTHTYGDPGVYKIALTSERDCSCPGTYTIEVTVIQAEEPQQISCPTVTCENSIETFTFYPKICDHISWAVEGGTILNGTEDEPVLEVKWDDIDQSGFGLVKLFQNDCLCNATSVKVPVVQENGHIEGPHRVCLGEQNLYRLPQWPTTDFNWILTDMGGADFSQYLTYTDQRNEIMVSPDANIPSGNYVLKANYENTLKKCTGSAELQITVISKRHEIIGPAQACVGDPVNFETVDPDPIAGWTINGPNGFIMDIGQDNLTYTFNNPGVYTLMVGSMDFCMSQFHTITIYDNPPEPQGDFDLPSEICAGVPYTINFSDEDGLGSTYDIEWQVSDGEIQGSDVGQNIQVIFDPITSGDYQVAVRYKLKNSAGCASTWLNSTLVPPVSVNGDIEAFDVLTGEVLTNNTFCTSTDAWFRINDLSGVEYDWSVSPSNFANIVQGNNSPQITVNFNEIANGVTSGSIQLRVRKCTQWITVNDYQVDLIEAPALTWDLPTEICAGEFFDLTITSAVPITSYDSVELKLGNSQTITTATQLDPVTFQFNNIIFLNTDPQDVLRTVSLNIEGPNGCTNPSFINDQLTLHPKPVAIIISSTNSRSYCNLGDLQNENIQLTAVEQGGIVNTNWQWYNGSAQIPGATSATLNVTAPGDYRVEATSAYGCSSFSSTYAITIKDCTLPPGTGEPGDGDNPGNPPGTCSQSVDDILLTWSSCNTITAQLPSSATPTSYNWAADGEDISLSGTSGNTASFSPALPGTYNITAMPEFSDCAYFRSEIITIAYQARLDYSVVCNSNGNYTVELINNSPFIAGQPPTQTVFYHNGGSAQTYAGNEPQHTYTGIPPGSHTFSLEISDQGFPVCTASFSVNLEAPDASFNLPVQEICEGEPLALAPANPQPGYRYEWEFNDVTNKQQSPAITFNDIGATDDFQVSLMVTGPYGCSTSTFQNIMVNVFDADGIIQGYQDPVCQGETVVLSFMPADPVNPPSHYQWIKDEQPIPGASGASYTADSSGLYGLLLTDANGCSKRLDPVSVVVRPLPWVNISGPLGVCAGEDFVLHGSSGESSLPRRWLRDGNPLTTLSTQTPWELELNENNIGTYTYTLEVGNANAGDCVNTTQYSVEVYPVPRPSDVAWSFRVNCNPFEAMVNITNPDPQGTYTWSNGDSGTHTTLTMSGAFAVRYTNAYGCSVIKQAVIPTLPEELLWVFPTGCIEVCEDPNAFPGDEAYVIGPHGLVDTYAWVWNGNANPQSHTLVPPIEPRPYDLRLLLGAEVLGTYCEVESNALTMDISPNGCDTCEEEFILEIENIDEEWIPEPPYYKYLLQANLINPSGVAATYQLTSFQGTYYPATFSLLPWQSQNVIIEFVPDPGFAGGFSTMYIKVLNGTHILCVGDQQIPFPLSPQPSPRPSASESWTEFSVLPNPSRASIEVYYNLGDEQAENLSIYNMLGQKLMHQELTQSQAKVHLDMTGLSSGNYIVILSGDKGHQQQQLLIKE